MYILRFVPLPFPKIHHKFAELSTLKHFYSKERPQGMGTGELVAFSQSPAGHFATVFKLLLP